MPDSVYQAGEPVPIQATFKNAAGALTNTTVTVEVRAPDGTITTPAVTNSSTGVYDATVPAVTQPGLWWYSFIGTGAVSATEQKSFYVQARYTQTGQYPLASYALISLDDAREYVLGSPSDNRLDEKLIDRINEMSSAVKTYTRREWLPAPVTATRTFNYRGRGPLSLGAYDLRTVTSMTLYTDLPTVNQTVLVPGSSTVLGDYRLGPSGGMPPAATYRWVLFNVLVPRYQFPYFGGYEVTITGSWGIGTIPADVKLAVKIALKNSIENPEGAASRTIGPLSLNEPLETAAAGEPWRALPAESRALLADYRDDPLIIAA